MLKPVKIVKVTQADIDKLPADIRNNPAAMALINTIVTTYTKLEQLLGYDVVLSDAPAGEVPVDDPEPKPGCTCSSARAGYSGTRERINTSHGPTRDLRGIMNDYTGNCTWVTDAMIPHVHFDGTTMRVECFDLGGGVKAHFVGWKQPHSAGPMRTENPATVAKSGTLRLYWESRK